jgi:hypothetical protein
MMETFSGYADTAKQQKRTEKIVRLIDSSSFIVRAVFNTVSTLIKIVGIYKILKSLKQL